ncbi:MAG: TlpA family protein disulfide reductase [Deltaproteobacteria bacterium]|nr:TlpA family protein disulfide reductase [Deltaproteobacteria bacterium]
MSESDVHSDALRRRLPLAIALAVSLALVWIAKGTPLYDNLGLIQDGEIAPDFSLKRTDDDSTRLSQLRGYVVWIVFGRTTDSDCVTQLEEARALSKEFRDRGLAILFLAQSQSKTDIEQFVAERGSAAQILFDNGGRVADVYHASDLPTSYLISKTGHVMASKRGVWRANDARLRRLVDEGIRSGSRNNPAPFDANPGADDEAIPTPSDEAPEGAAP